MRRSNVRARNAIADRYRMKRRELFLLLSAAMIAPRLVSAQRRGTSRVGVLDPNPGPRQSTLAAIHEGLEDAGFSSFGLVSIEYRWAGWTDSRFNPLITLAIDLVVCDVDVIVTATFSGIQAVKAATSSIPIVFIGDGNVITAGLIESPDEPGSNLTGIGLPSEGYLKQFELLTELLPQARVIAVLINPNSKAAERQIQEVQEAARGMGIQVKILKADMDVDFGTVFADLASANVAGLLFALAAGSALRQLSPCDYGRFWRWGPSASGEFTVYKKGWLATLHRNPVKNLILFSDLPTQSASTNLP